MTKAELLQELMYRNYVTIKPSPLHGIGVFAIRDIPNGTRDIFSKSKHKWITISKDEVKILPQHSKDIIENHCLFDDENYFIPEYGFTMIDLVIFLNHSDTPNLISINDGEFFEAIVDIKCGEELLIDYGTIVESEE